MYYEKVKDSFFTYPAWYDRIFKELKENDKFVEIGTWTGASSIYFAELMIAHNKKIDFTTIDTFEGSIELQEFDAIKNKSLYDYYLSVREPVKDYIKVIKANSQIKSTSDLFEDESIDAIFIDGDHSHAGVKRDLENWWPKMKKGSIFSGHDYIWGNQGVKPIVDFFSNFRVIQFWQGDVWHYYKD